MLEEKDKLPPASVWTTAFFHLVKTPVGSYLASNILIELCEYFLRAGSKQRSKLIKPDAAIFNLVLGSCVRFGSALKARQVFDLMPKMGIVTDANSIAIIARVYEMNGQREDLKRLKEHVDGASSALLHRHHRQFYDCLLSLHFKFNDVDAAASLILDLYKRPSSIARSSSSTPGRPREVQIGSGNLKMGCKMTIDPNLSNSDSVVGSESLPGLVVLTDGRLVPSGKALAKLVNRYARDGNVGGLSNLLVSIHKVMGCSGGAAGLSSDVIGACVELGWLDTAHDIVDDMESAGIRVSEATYALLLRAYHEKGKLEEAKVLLKQAKKGGGGGGGLPVMNLSEQSISEEHNHMDENAAMASVSKSCLVDFLERERTRGGGGDDDDSDSAVRSLHEFNSSIFFFCEAKMMEDATKTFRRMQEREIRPTVQTFSHLVNGYSSLEMYREITILWGGGEIKRRLEGGDLAAAADRDLFECLLWNFIRGGYFERAMEIVGYMRKHSMYADKWKCRSEFLKLHKDLYRNLNAANARTDAQSKRLEHVRAFRRWVSIDGRRS